MTLPTLARVAVIASLVAGAPVARAHGASSGHSGAGGRGGTAHGHRASGHHHRGSGHGLHRHRPAGEVFVPMMGSFGEDTLRRDLPYELDPYYASPASPGYVPYCDARSLYYDPESCEDMIE